MLPQRPEGAYPDLPIPARHPTCTRPRTYVSVCAGPCLSLLAALLATAGSGWNALGAESPKPTTDESRYEAPKHLTGAVYAVGHDQLLFNFTRTAARSGSTLRVQRDFTYSDGKLAARERVLYDGNVLTSYELEELQIGAHGSTTLRRSDNHSTAGRIVFEYVAKPGAQPKVHTEAAQPDTLVADMVGPFLASHWDALQRGEKVKCRYIVVPRAETVGFTFSKDSKATAGRKDVVIVTMEPTSPFIAALVDPLFFTLELAPPHRILQYTGRTTPKIQVGGKWKDLDAVTVFDWKSVP